MHTRDHLISKRNYHSQWHPPTSLADHADPMLVPPTNKPATTLKAQTIKSTGTYPRGPLLKAQITPNQCHRHHRGLGPHDAHTQPKMQTLSNRNGRNPASCYHQHSLSALCCSTSLLDELPRRNCRNQIPHQFAFHVLCIM